MSHPNHAIARAFFEALSNSELPDALLSPDMTAWTTSSGTDRDKAAYQFGISLLGKIFQGRYEYKVHSLTAEEDRVAAEVEANGTLVNGNPYSSRYVFILRIKDGKITSVAEHMDPRRVQEDLGPLLQAAMAKAD